MKEDYLKPAELNENPEYNTNPSGMGSIARFNSYQFGSTFSRVLRIFHETKTVDIDPDSGNARVQIGFPRVKDSIIYGRICNYPNTSGIYWKTLQEEEPLDDPTAVGGRPYVTFKYNGSNIEFINSVDAPTAGDKVVIQLLFVEL